MKLTDTQLVILSAASQREDSAIELALNLKGAAANKLVDKLLADGLIEEIQACGSLPVWRRDEDKGPLALRITKRGLAAIQVDEGGAREKTKEHRDTKNGANLAPHNPSRRVAAAPRKKTRDEAPRRSAKSSHGASKQDGVIEMLQRRQGATIATIMKVIIDLEHDLLTVYFEHSKIVLLVWIICVTEIIVRCDGLYDPLDCFVA